MTLGNARDIALLLLIAEWFVVGLVPLALLYLAVRGLQRLLPRVRIWLSTFRGWVLVAERLVAVAMQWLLAPVLLLAGLGAGLREGFAVVRKR